MEYRVVVVGDKQVGKTSLIAKFISGEFPNSPEYTIEDKEHRKKVTIPGEEPCIIKVIDTAFTGRDYMKNKAQAYILLYDITERKTFEELDLYIKNIREVNQFQDNQFVPFVVVGNKKDVVDFKSGAREVRASQGKSLAKKLGKKCCFYEVSARDGTNVELVFQQAVKELWMSLEISAGVKQHGDGCLVQ